MSYFLQMLNDEINYSLNLNVKNSVIPNISCLKLLDNSSYHFDCKNISFHEIDLTGIDFAIDDKHILIYNENYIQIYKYTYKLGTLTRNSIIKLRLYKTITISIISFFNNSHKSVRKFLLKLLLSLIKIQRSDLIIEGIVNYMNLKDVISIKECADGFIAKYNNGEQIAYNTNFNILGCIKSDENNKSNLFEKLLIPKPNNFVQKNFMIKVTSDNVFIYRNNTKFINRRKIPNIKKCYIYKNLLFLLTSNKLLVMEFEPIK
ncbi:hypothetical protein NUSPORA_02116 [Nucleospora cyclopteri]